MISHPRFTKHIVKNNKFAQNPLLVVDVGARGGTEPHWAHYKNQVKIVAFEPDEKECEALNRQNTSSRITFYPFALHKKEGTYTFYEMGTPAGSSFYKANSGFVERFPDEVNVATKGERRVQATTLDLFLGQHNIADVDFIKVDTEGAELDVLEGSVNTLKNSVLGISCEVLFVPWRENKIVFSDIERFLSGLGFRLYDLDLHRFARKAFPGPNSVLENVSGSADWGQIIVGQAIFFRDPIEEIKNEDNAFRWDEARIYKLASLFEVFGLPDSAIELLKLARQGRLITIEDKALNNYNDLISKSYSGVTYKKYFKNLEKIRRRGYANFYEMFRVHIRKNILARKIYYFLRKPVK